MINKKRIVKLLQRLIQINSENPPGSEQKIAAFTQGYLAKIGVKSKIYEFKKNRSNIISYLPGEDKKRSLLITPHLDTVPAGKNWHFDPFAGAIRENKIYGLGATDCKCNLAAALEVINSLVETRRILGYTLILAATADEESGSELGLIPLLDKGILKPHAALVLDADNFNVIVAQKGLIHLKVKIRGKKAHGAYPWLGVNAISVAVEILHQLKNYKPASIKNKYLRPPTLNIGAIRGGDKVNVVADWCEFELDFRFLPGTPADRILKNLKEIIRKHTRRFKIEIEGIQQPYLINENHSLVKYLTAAMKKAGVRPSIQGSEGATTITFFQDKNIPAVATGFGAEGCAHTVDEFAKTENLYKGALALEEFLKAYSFKND